MLLEIPPAILGKFASLTGRPHRAYGAGLINDTFLVEGRDGPAIVQRLHPIFGATVNEDIFAVTSHLARKGQLTPLLLRTDAGALSTLDDAGRPWRAQTFIAGESMDRVPSPEVAHESGRLVTGFHLALGDFSYDYQHVRNNVHDTRAHLATLRRALEEQRSHRLHAEVAKAAASLLTEAEALPDLTRLPLRHCHGDLKISNLLFRHGKGLCLVDLDTVGRMPWPLEMGDALRSWCNPRGEDEADAALSLELFTAALTGVGEVARPAGLLSDAEARALVSGLATICLELAARFLADALEERYFGFDARRFATRGEHNRVRGLGQLALYRSVRAQQRALEDVAARALRA